MRTNDIEKITMQSACIEANRLFLAADRLSPKYSYFKILHPNNIHFRLTGILFICLFIN